MNSTRLDPNTDDLDSDVFECLRCGEPHSVLMMSERTDDLCLDCEEKDSQSLTWGR
jgi:hypothetical protein